MKNQVTKIFECMEVQQIYTENINNILFSKNDRIKKLREKILKKFTKDYLNKKNNALDWETISLHNYNLLRFKKLNKLFLFCLS